MFHQHIFGALWLNSFLVKFPSIKLNDIKDDMELCLGRSIPLFIGPMWKHFITVSAEL